MAFLKGIKVIAQIIGRGLRLRKDIYSFKQSARIWNEIFKREIEKMGFKAISSDACIFIRVQDNKLIIIALYVDNILIIIKSSDLIRLRMGLRRLSKSRILGL